jgi:hypothetical protein
MAGPAEIFTSSTGSGIAVFFLVVVLVYLAVAVVTIVAWVKILSKAGYPGVWVLIGLVPVVNVVMFLVFAFSTWPIEQQLAAARAQGPGAAPPWSPGPVPTGGYLPSGPGGPAAPAAGSPPPVAPPPPPYGGTMV